MNDIEYPAGTTKDTSMIEDRIARVIRILPEILYFLTSIKMFMMS